MDTKRISRSKVLPIIITICVTITLVAGVGGWVYTQKQQIAEKNREFQQKQATAKQQEEDSLKRLKYQECETTQRQGQAKGGFYVAEKCELKL